MSNKSEREQVGGMLLAEWKYFADILDERGETWATTDPMKWPRDSSLWGLDHVIRRLLDVAKVIGLKVDRASLESDHRAIQKYKEMYPDGPPKLEDLVKARPPAA